MAAQVITSRGIHALTGRTYPGLEWGVPSPTSQLRRLLTGYKQYRRYRETVAELGRLSDHVLADMGIGRHRIGEIARTLSRRVG